MMSEGATSITVDGREVSLRSPRMREIFALVHRVAQTNSAVLICGETGTGKELIARALHHFSLRCNAAFIDINCGALPEHLVESELFGHEKGAFSGAEAMKPGMFELANGGTMFLDEIGELEMKLQVKLLRVLDRVPYFRVGGTKKISTDVRFVAATNRNLKAAIGDGSFRSDLYHRLATVEIDVPPLRERREDIVAIAEQVIAETNPALTFDAQARRAMEDYAWPGNIRELKNVVTRAAISASGCVITAQDLGQFPVSDAQSTDSFRIDDMERAMIIRCLEAHSGDQQKAASALGISRRTLVRKLKAFAAKA